MQKAGGTFTLTADVDFGATYGLKSVYFKSRNTPSTAGIVRLGNNESVGWRNAANNANLELKVNASNVLEFNSSIIGLLAAALTASRALVSDGSGNISVSSVTSTKLAYLASATGTTGTTSTNLVFSTSPTLVTPVLGVASATSINKVAITAPATGSTLTIADGKTLTASNTLTMTATDGSTAAFGAGGTVVYESTAQTLSSKTLTAPIIDQANFTQAASATTPASGKSAVYVNSGDAKLHVVDSSGNDVAVGSGSSGRNYLSDWYDSAKAESVGTSAATSTGNRTVAGNTDPTKWVTSDLTNLTFARSADTTLRQSYNYLINSGDANADFVESPLFTLDGRDLGKPVSVSFDCAGVSASDDYQVCAVRYNSSGTYQEVITIAGTASATTPYSARIPVGTTSFNGFFIAGATATDQYAIRFMKHAVNVDLRIDSLYVGPQSVVQGAAVCDPVAFTTTKSAGLGGSTETLWYARSGKMMQLWGSITVGTVAASAATLTMPTGLTIDSSYLDASGTARLGHFSNLRNASTALYSGGYAGDVYYNGTTNVIALDCNSASRAYPGAAASGVMSSSDVLTISALIPIAEWSSNVTMANRAVEEYAYNSGTWDTASDTTSFGYGASGAAIGGALSADAIKYVQFQTPIQPTDKLFLEYKVPSTNTWVDAANSIYPGVNLPSVAFGAQIYYDLVSSTQVKVYFNRYAKAGTTYNSLTGAVAWSAAGHSHWRVRKVSGGASVGYPVSTANIVGRTDGTTVGSGYIGEKLGGAVGSPVSLTTNTPANGASLSLTPGVWQIFATCYFDGTGSTTWSDTSFIGITTTSATIPADDTVAVVYPTSLKDHTLKTSTVVNVAATTTYYMVVQATFGASTAAVRASYSSFYAIRIA